MSKRKPARARKARAPSKVRSKAVWAIEHVAQRIDGKVRSQVACGWACGADDQ
jgi:hypothetical protein